MGDESYLDNKQEVMDFENMKVTELKKRLKSFGLSVAGNKSELIERLQNAMDSEKGIETMPEVDSTLINDSSETLALNESENHLVEDFSLSSSEKDESKEQPSKSVDSTTNSNPASIPLKKRAVAQAAAETVKVEKKIVLKRNNIPTPTFIPIKTAVCLNIKSTITMDKTESEDADKQLEDDKTESSLDGKSVIRLSKTAAKSELEKFVLRAERFKTDDSKDQSKSEISAPSLATAVTSNVSSIPSSANLSNIDALKRRAERFGQNVSSVMKKMEDQERILKRKCKFGNVGAGNGISTTEEQEKKKKRAERFGM